MSDKPTYKQHYEHVDNVINAETVNNYYAGADPESPPIPPAVDLPNLLPVANNLIGHAAEREQLNGWFDAMAAVRHGALRSSLGGPAMASARCCKRWLMISVSRVAQHCCCAAGRAAANCKAA